MAVEDREIVIIGSGPAGSAAAHQCALAGLSPLLVERDQTPGAHNACGGLALHALRDRLGLPDDVVEREVWRTILTIDGRRFEYGGKHPHYISFRRVMFDTYLARRAVEAGAELLASTRANILQPSEHRIGLKNLTTGVEREVRAQVIVFADGPLTLAADAYGIGHRRGPRTREALFVELEGPYGDGESIEMVLSTAYTKSHFWLFPKRDCLWAGLGSTIGAASGTPLKVRLAQFIQQRDDLRGRRIRHRGAGLVPSDVAAELVSDGAMVVGDAAGLVNPMTGGGIAFALASGMLAGRVVAKAVKAGRVDRIGLMRYPRELRLTPHYLWLVSMGYWRRWLDCMPSARQPAAYARMLRHYLSFLHHARGLVNEALGPCRL